MTARKIRRLFVFGVAGAITFGLIPAYGASSEGERVQLAFLHTLFHDHGSHHDSKHGAHHSHHGHHSKGCFVTTTPQNHARGIRHWVSPCPHRELKHMNPYHPPHHKMRYNPHTRSHHRIEE